MCACDCPVLHPCCAGYLRVLHVSPSSGRGAAGAAPITSATVALREASSGKTWRLRGLDGAEGGSASALAGALVRVTGTVGSGG